MPPSGAAAELADIRTANAAGFEDTGKLGKAEAAFLAADCITSFLGLPVRAPGFQVSHPISPGQGNLADQILHDGADAKFRKSKIKIKKNPWFERNGHFDEKDDEDTHSPVTRAYLQSRSFKSVAGASIGLAGSFAATHTVVNVGGIARHTSALASTSVHLLGILSIARARA